MLPLEGVGARSAARPASTPLLCAAFSGRQPDVVIIDAENAADALPLRHARRLLVNAWGDDAPVPPCFALLGPQHMGQPDWVAFVDDFALPPFSPREAAARVALLLFRKRFLTATDCLEFAGLKVDLAAGSVVAQGCDRPLALTPREYELLRFLLVHRGKFFARERLLDMVWGLDFAGGERTVDIHVRRLRAKLPASVADRLETRRNIGYGFNITPD
jgi:two-component system alkaline phosphatase synthesis response regulator PhoP